MAAEPQRKPEPTKYLDASLVPLERALRARADVLQVEAAQDAGNLVNTVKAGVAVELLKLADELHHW